MESVLPMTVTGEWSLHVLILIHEPFITFSLLCPTEEGRDRAALVESSIQPGPTWCSRITLVLAGTCKSEAFLYCLNSSLLLRSTQLCCYCLRYCPKCAWESGPLRVKTQLKKPLLFDSRRIIHCPVWKNEPLRWQTVSGERWAFSIDSRWKSFLYFIDTFFSSATEEDKLSQKRSYIWKKRDSS